MKTSAEIKTAWQNHPDHMNFEKIQKNLNEVQEELFMALQQSKNHRQKTFINFLYRELRKLKFGIILMEDKQNGGKK